MSGLLNNMFFSATNRIDPILGFAVVNLLPDKGMTALNLEEDGNFTIQFKRSYVGKVHGLGKEFADTTLKVAQTVTGRMDEKKGIIQFDPGTIMIDLKARITVFFYEKNIEIGGALTEISVDKDNTKPAVEMTGKSRSEGILIKTLLNLIKNFTGLKGRDAFSLTDTVLLSQLPNISWKKA